MKLKFLVVLFLILNPAIGFSGEYAGAVVSDTHILTQAFPELKDLQPKTDSAEWKPKLLEISSKSLRKKGKFLIYLPPGYKGSGSDKFGVVYFLHGLGDNCTTWLEGEQNVALIVTLLVERGEIQPMILVAPEGERGFWMNSADSSVLYEDWVLKDLRKYVEKNYRTINDRNHRAIRECRWGDSVLLK